MIIQEIFSNNVEKQKKQNYRVIMTKFIFLRFYLFIHERQRERDREREREVETQAEGEAGSMQGARHGT